MIRLTGMNSGLDTDAIIQDLVKARRQKVDKVKSEQTKTSWKQDKWKELNSKISKFYSSLDKLRFSSAYNTKKTTVSSPNVASISTSNDAPITSCTMNIKQLAVSANLTGEKIEAKSTTTLSELGLTEAGQFEIKLENGESKTIEYDSTTTVQDIRKKMADAGLQVNFDSMNKRFFINSKEQGQNSNFSFENDTANALDILGLSNARYNEGRDLEITLNGIDYTNNTNTIEVNGLTINAQQTTAGDVTITTSQDTTGIYNSIKDFVKQYNELVKEIDKLYNADSSKDYQMLTDEEKEDMSEKEIEQWESKIKDSLLRRDETLGSIYNVFKNITVSGFTLDDGTNMSLSSLGIGTGNYFSAPTNEKYLLHIDGDNDDSTTSGKTNKLEMLIQSDPQKVGELFSKLTDKLYTELSKRSSSVANYRTYGSFYNDKKLKSDYDSYNSKIKIEEKRLDSFMDKYYKQFAKMETALAKLNSSQTSLTNFFGQ